MQGNGFWLKHNRLKMQSYENLKQIALSLVEKIPMLLQLKTTLEKYMNNCKN